MGQPGPPRPEFPAVAERARPLLDVLFDDLEPGERVNLRGLCGDRAWNRFARTPDEAVQIARELVGQPGTDVLLGVLPRRGDDGTARGLRRGTCLWVDIDPLEVSDGATLAWRRLARFSIQPSAVVHSGRGLHAYWRLASGSPLDAPTEWHRFGDALRRLAHALGGDLVATDPARVLRLPGSLNWKYLPARPVSILVVRPGQRTTLEQMLAILPPAPPRTRDRRTADGAPMRRATRGVGDPNEGGVTARAEGRERRWVSRLLLHGVGVGQRNAACARLAGYLLGRGLPPDIARAIVLGFAARCRPPLSPAEAARVVWSIARYRRGIAPGSGRYIASETADT